MITVFEALSAEDLNRVRALVSDVPPEAWRAGVADKRIRHLKKNLQMLDPPAELSRLVGVSLMQSFAFVAHAIPEEIGAPVLSKYSVGDGYGFHVDNAMRGVAKRRDLAVSVALNDDYEGGELAFKFGSLETPLRLRAGQAVVFPAQLAHKVQPVTSGERLVAILWVTSRIPDAMEREIVISLQRAQELCLSDAPEDRAELVDVLAFGTQNLLKRWLR